jgi:magnesium transporter
MIRSLYRTGDGQLKTNLEPDAFAAAKQDAGGLLWIDLVEEPPEVCEPILHETFGFHPLAVDDALQESHVPKVDDWGEYVYLVLHAIAFDEHSLDGPRHDDGRMDTYELDIFLGRNYLVSHHDQQITAVDRVWELCHRDERHLLKGADHLLYRIADELVTSYMPIVEEMDAAFDEFEDQIVANPDSRTLERLFSLKRVLLYQRRILTPQREVLNKLARDDYAVIDADSRIFFRDVYDHMVRLHDINESMRDLVGGALDTYLSVINNRMNDIMKTLTIITTMFMPLTFVTGFFGMNFFIPPGEAPIWATRVLFVIMMVMMSAIPIVMFRWMRKRAWM